MKKPYVAHEVPYRKLRKKGLRCWDALASGKRKREIDRYTVRFLQDVFAQPWVPREGKAIELGCGTGPMIRWVCRRRTFTGLGIDVSRTAITMAREQSRGLPIRFRVADACGPLSIKPGTLDLAIDGHCLHCITASRDRRAFLTNVRRLLKAGGVLVVLSMCAPVDRKAVPRVFKNQKLVGHTVYVFADRAGEYDGARKIGGQAALPSRYVGHWKDILKEIARAGFRLQLIRLSKPWSTEEPCSYLTVGAIAT